MNKKKKYPFIDYDQVSESEARRAEKVTDYYDEQDRRYTKFKKIQLLKKTGKVLLMTVLVVFGWACIAGAIMIFGKH